MPIYVIFVCTRIWVLTIGYVSTYVHECRSIETRPLLMLLEKSSPYVLTVHVAYHLLIHVHTCVYVCTSRISAAKVPNPQSALSHMA